MYHTFLSLPTTDRWVRKHVLVSGSPVRHRILQQSCSWNEHDEWKQVYSSKQEALNHFVITHLPVLAIQHLISTNCQHWNSPCLLTCFPKDDFSFFPNMLIRCFWMAVNKVNGVNAFIKGCELLGKKSEKQKCIKLKA